MKIIVYFLDDPKTGISNMGIAFRAFKLQPTDRKKLPQLAVSPQHNPEVKLHKLEKHFVTGDFEGRRKQDTLFEHHFSRTQQAEIECAADPFQNEWDTVVHWFYDQDADLFLTTNKSNNDTLHLGTAQGLYCLINIGDNNADGRDEIALVID